MALSLEDIKPRRDTSPPRCIFYGVPKIGKTTLASEFPDPVFIQTEQGAGSMELTTFANKPFTEYGQVFDAIALLYEGGHGFKTVVLDSLTRLEPLVWAETCKRLNCTSIEDPGYGKGYLEADVEWRALIDGFNSLRDTCGMNIVFLAHEEVRAFSNPMGDDFNHYRMRLHKRAEAMLVENTDVIGFLNYVVSVSTDDKKGKPGKASGSGSRMLHLTERPSYRAGNRYSMPDTALMVEGEMYQAIAPFLPSQETHSKAEAA